LRVLILGSNGQIGRCLQDQLKINNFEIIYTSRKEIDISNFEETKKKITNINPHIIINASAYTNVDKAEEDIVNANIINNLAVANLANISSVFGYWLIHISTDYVFDGKSTTPYSEKDKVDPQSVYGISKLKGELAIKASKCNYLIFRISWVFSEYGNNFLINMLKLGLSNKKLNIVSDQQGCPTYAQDFAKMINIVLGKIYNKKIHSDLFHFCGDQQCSWYDFASYIFEEAKILGFKTPDYLNSILTEVYPTKATRPLYSVLECKKIKKILGIDLPNWRNGIKDALLNIKLK